MHFLVAFIYRHFLKSQRVIQVRCHELLIQTWKKSVLSFPIHTFPGVGGVRSTVIPSEQLLNGSNVCVHVSCRIIVVLAWIQAMYRLPWDMLPFTNSAFM